jgi:hypothetical protein
LRRDAIRPDRQTPKSAARRRNIEEELRFLQRSALLKEPVEADSRQPNEIPEEDMVSLTSPTGS